MTQIALRRRNKRVTGVASAAVIAAPKVHDRSTGRPGQARPGPNGACKDRQAVAVVIFGETHYAGFQGEVADLDFHPEEPVQVLNRLRAASIRLQRYQRLVDRIASSAVGQLMDRLAPMRADFVATLPAHQASLDAHYRTEPFRRSA